MARLEEATLAKVKERAASLQDVQNLLHWVLRVSQSVSFLPAVARAAATVRPPPRPRQ